MEHDIDFNLAEAQLGESCKDFLASEVGRLILGRAKVDITEALEDLKTVDPDDKKKITDLQNQIYRAESVVGWLNEAIENGDAAYELLQTDED